MKSLSFKTRMFYFLLFCFAGFCFAALIPFLLFTMMGDDCSPTFLLQCTQWGQTLLLMILPPILWVKYYEHRPVVPTLYLRRCPLRILLLTALLVVVAVPLLDALAAGNALLPLPAGVEAFCRSQQQLSEQAMQTMLDIQGVGAWAVTIALVSVATAVGEELMFRGALLHLFRQLSWSRWVVAVVLGFVFAAIHFDIYGFVPRWVLGTFFVSLVYWTGSLWPGVVAHALNNLFALLEYKGVLPVQDSFMTQSVAVGCSVLLVACVGVWIYRISTPSGVTIRR